MRIVATNKNKMADCLPVDCRSGVRFQTPLVSRFQRSARIAKARQSLARMRSATTYDNCNNHTNSLNETCYPVFPW